MTRHSVPIRRLAAAVAALVFAGCGGDGSPLDLPDPGGELFLRYVAMGNSITAGFQSGGINVDLQEEAYPVLLAAKAGASFGIPALAMPGCPPPLAGPLSNRRISGSPCAYRVASQTPPLVQNVAVPGALMADATDLDGPGSNFLTTLILGGRTQAQTMLDADPTLVSVWLGNNDALAAVLAGDTTRLTPLDSFATELQKVVNALLQADPMDVLIIGVADPAVAAPAVQPGAYFWAAAHTGEAPVPLVASDNCAPDQPGGSHLVSLRVAEEYVAGREPAVEVDCGDDAPYLLNDAERAAVEARIEGFNQLLRAAAERHGWLYVDPLTTFIQPALALPDQVRKCQGLAAATDSASLAAAVRATCPHASAPGIFGSHFSFDAVHPSSAAHAAIADALARLINERHGLSLTLDG